MNFEESSKCCHTSTTNTNLEFYGKIKGMTLHLKKLPKLFKATTIRFPSFLKLYAIRIL